MKIVLSTEENLELFRPYLPDSLLHAPLTLLGCLDEDVPCGFLALTRSAVDIEISWIWVAPEQRRRGVGTALLNAAIDHLMQNGAAQLLVSYHAEEPYSAVLDFMLARRHFILETENVPYFSIDREQLLASSLLHKLLKKPGMGSDIVPLRQLDSTQLRETMKSCMRKNTYFASEAELLQADSSRSMVMLADGVVKGLILFQHTKQEGVISLSLLYLEHSYILKAGFLLQESVKAILQPAANLKRLEFFCIEEEIRAMAVRIFGEACETQRRITRGVLWAELHQGGSRR